MPFEVNANKTYFTEAAAAVLGFLGFKSKGATRAACWIAGGGLLAYKYGAKAVNAVTGTASVNVDFSANTPYTADSLKAQFSKAAQYMPLFKAAADYYKIDYSILLGIASRESGFNPDAEGFNGDDFGMMQINQKAHPDFFSQYTWSDPHDSIYYGAFVYAQNQNYLTKSYDMSEKEYIIAAASAYNAGLSRVLKNIDNPDSVTYGGDYGTDVYNLAVAFKRYFGE
jgi:soluble lytic murein transglycosylase-like protein